MIDKNKIPKSLLPIVEDRLKGLAIAHTTIHE